MFNLNSLQFFLKIQALASLVTKDIKIQPFSFVNWPCNLLLNGLIFFSSGSGHKYIAIFVYKLAKYMRARRNSS